MTFAIDQGGVKGTKKEVLSDELSKTCVKFTGPAVHSLKGSGTNPRS